jgi:hypothetical protein
LENFSSNDYQRLAKIFIKYVNPGDLDFCFKFFQAACSASNTKAHPFKEGLGNIIFSSKCIISPFIHLFLTPFDEYLEKLSKELFIRSSSLRPLALERDKPYPLRSWDVAEPNQARASIRFVRYADKFIVGVSGNHKEAIYIKELLNSFFYKELGLNLKTNSINVIHLGSQSAEFLGYYITTKSSTLKDIKYPFQPNPLSPKEIYLRGKKKKVRNASIASLASSVPLRGKNINEGIIPKLVINKKAIKE